VDNNDLTISVSRHARPALWYFPPQSDLCIQVDNDDVDLKSLTKRKRAILESLLEYTLEKLYLIEKEELSV
jgi:hypothetical protein